LKTNYLLICIKNEKVTAKKRVTGRVTTKSQKAKAVLTNFTPYQEEVLDYEKHF